MSVPKGKNLLKSDCTGAMISNSPGSEYLSTHIFLVAPLMAAPEVGSVIPVSESNLKKSILHAPICGIIFYVFNLKKWIMLKEHRILTRKDNRPGRYRSDSINQWSHSSIYNSFQF